VGCQNQRELLEEVQLLLIFATLGDMQSASCFAVVVFSMSMFGLQSSKDSIHHLRTNDFFVS
jgi:hypothetical protein